MPVLFTAAVLNHAGQLGPARDSRASTASPVGSYSWRAAQMGMPMKLPPAHPFNPLGALRLDHRRGRRQTSGGNGGGAMQCSCTAGTLPIQR